jgi:ribonuclease HII
MVEHKYVVGVDEAGTGSLAGSFIVAAVAFPTDATRVTTMWRGVHADKQLVAGDSKGVRNEAHRAALAIAVRASATSVATIEKTASEIDERLFSVVFPEALKLAAARCIERLHSLDPALTSDEILVLIDGDVPRPDLPCPVKCIPDGDKKDWRIGAASLVAKALHDERINALAERYPDWQFERHRGYPTKTHKLLLNKRGPLDVHRKSFKPVQAVLPPTEGVEL